MKFDIPDIDDLKNESDVEQKFVFPLLVALEPIGLGIPQSAIQTKQNIRRFAIGKGSDLKKYFPDYLIVWGGIPLVVIEAKTPGEDLEEAFREARLYASELNANYRPGINPVSKVVATDGTRLLFGSADHATPELDIQHSEFGSYSEKMASLHEKIGSSALAKEYVKISSRIKPDKLWKPRRLLGGGSVQHEEIGHNTFGATLSAEYAHIFNPATQFDRIRIATEGYIPSKRRERYVDPIDQVIRASRPPSEAYSILIENSASPKEIIDALKKAKPLEHQVLLIVGSVGAGKSTFVDHLQYKALPQDVRDTTVWVRLNMNHAPVVKNEIYNWLKKEIINGCIAAYPEIDFEELNTLKAVFSVEVNQFNKGVGQLYKETPQVFNEKLAEHLEKVMADSNKQAVAYTRYCSTQRGKLLIVVLDNCDKRERDEQLLMFEAAQWVQKEFRALVILPLREETYDNHRNEPPLDTALKDLVFRIEPPLFQHVLVKRIQMVLNEINQSGEKTFRYDLPNGFHVEYIASEKAYYLTAILRAIFDYDRFVRRMIVGLAGRNIRRALEIFLEFCSSGHITEDHIFKIRTTAGKHTLPLPLVVRVLLRGNRRFYDSDYSYVKNVVAADAKDSRPTYFCRLLILRWLYKNFSAQGPSGHKGYFSLGAIVNEISIYGIEEAVIRREVEYLAKATCVISEDFRTENLTNADLIRLGPAGFVHLDILSDVDYLAAIAEDTWFETEDVARDVAKRISNLDIHYHPTTVIANAKVLITHLKGVRQREAKAAQALLENSHFEELTDLSDAEQQLARGERQQPLGWADVNIRYVVGGHATGTVVNTNEHGVFVELEPGITGLIPEGKLPFGFQQKDEFSAGEEIVVKVLKIDVAQQRIKLIFVESAGA